MKNVILLFAINLIFLNLLISQVVKNCASDELIVKFKSGAVYNYTSGSVILKFGNFQIDSLNIKYNISDIKLTGNQNDHNTYVLKFTVQQNIEELITKYMSTGQFEYVEPNYIGEGGGRKAEFLNNPSDTSFSRQWGLVNDGSFQLSPSTIDSDIDMEQAWELIKDHESPTIIAILDGGTKLDHPEFNNRIWTNPNEIENNSDNDNNGYIDDVRGWNFAHSDNNPTDSYGHGTNVAGIIGANGNNELGYAGVDWNSELMICKILNEDNVGYYSWWADAIYYAVDNGAKVINMSVGGQNSSNTLEDAVNYAHENGTVIVACMMNYNNDVTYYPAGYEKTIAVGSTNPNDERSVPFFWSPVSGSNFGDHIDVVAPGNYIYGLNCVSNINYNTYWGGTSQATPLVTGLCALLIGQDPEVTPDSIRSLIRSSSEDLVGNELEDTPGFDNYYGYGRINAYQAMLRTPVDIDKTTMVDPIAIYPNPTVDNLSVLSKSAQITKINIISIHSLDVKSIRLSKKSNKISLNTSDLKSGIYFLKISTEDNDYFTRKFIKTSR
jgi:subtilase family protein/type IX secretion system substrate protein